MHTMPASITLVIPAISHCPQVQRFIKYVEYWKRMQLCGYKIAVPPTNQSRKHFLINHISVFFLGTEMYPRKSTEIE
jgi:hypothetical protein